MASSSFDRRKFLGQAAAGLAAGFTLGCDEQSQVVAPTPEKPLDRRPYQGPNVILIRFGGGVRRRETVQAAEQTFCPFVYHELIGKQGILFNNVGITSAPGIETSHGQGTLNVLTGKYDHYEDTTHKPFADRFEPKVPTIFECLRKHYEIPEHQTLLITGEDRINEEFYTFSNHHLYGVRYRSTVLSLYRFKTFLLREELKNPQLPAQERLVKEKMLREMETKDYRVADLKVASPELDRFWENWREFYGSTGFVNPRGDRLLTTLALRALRELRPKLLMINYQDPDYVHWGNSMVYTRSIAIIDEGIRQIHDVIRADEEYRDNTVVLLVPDCGRDNNRCMAVPFQHHFNSRSSHEIFVAAAGPGIAHPRVSVDKPREQISVAATVGQIMKFPVEHADSAAGCLDEMLA